MSRRISSTELSRRLQIPTATLFNLLQRRGWITRGADGWRLTAKGEFEGGRYIDSERFGTYIGWPEDIVEHRIFTSDPEAQRLGLETLAHQLDLGPRRCRLLLRELGWIRPARRGWVLTEAGRRLHGQQFEDPATGIPDVSWPREIVESAALQQRVAALAPLHLPGTDDEAAGEAGDLFASAAREPATYCCIDGHRHESLAHWRICEWLYLAGLAHACQHRLPGEESHYGDFYLPAEQLYIDYWGETAAQGELSAALGRKRRYESLALRHIELRAEDLAELDAVLGRRLLREGVLVD